MSTSLLTPLQSSTRASGGENVIVVAVMFSNEFTDAGATCLNFWGAATLDRCIANALRAANVKLNSSGAFNPALSRGVFMFFVPDVKTALAVIVEELHALGLEPWSVAGVFDRAEDYWRALHPANPRFDLNARMNQLMPLGRPGEKTKSQPHAEFRRAAEILKATTYPLPTFKTLPPTEPPTSSAPTAP